MSDDIESYLESISEASRPKKTLKIISRMVENFLKAAGINPDDEDKKLTQSEIDSAKKSRNNTWVTEIPISGHALLLNVFQLEASTDSGLWQTKEASNMQINGGPSKQVLDKMYECKELIECMLMSLEDDQEGGPGEDNDNQQNSSSVNANGTTTTQQTTDNNTKTSDDGATTAQGQKRDSDKKNLKKDQSSQSVEEEEDPELLAALAMSLGDGTVVDVLQPQQKKKKLDNMSNDQNQNLTDEEIARRMQNEENGGGAGNDDDDGQRDSSDKAPREHVDFQRFDDENIIIDPSRVEEVNMMQKALGEPYVDPQFPASDSALYMEQEDAKTWHCFGCGKRNPLPPLFAPPTSMEEARELQNKLDSVACRHCLRKPPHVAQVRFTHRPAVWLRPAPTSDRDQITEMLFPTITDVSIKSRLCTGFVRDDMGNTLGSKWAVIRDEARPEDVVQGAIGNCWFAGALSIVATKPELIAKLFVTKDFNPHGAYLVQLCHSGRWKGILLDDLFPCSKAWEGRIEGGSIYFARGGELSYLQSRRRQLWVPLIEKACAKLYSCYGALNSGTFSEALGLLTGYPVETMRLYESKAFKQAKAQERERKIAQRTMALLRGESIDNTDGDDDDDGLENVDESFEEDLL